MPNVTTIRQGFDSKTRTPLTDLTNMIQRGNTPAITIMCLIKGLGYRDYRAVYCSLAQTKLWDEETKAAN